MIELLILAFATWRITNLLVDDSEDGPFGLMHTIRYWLGVRYDDKHRPYGVHELGRIVTCHWCASIWVGLGVALFAWAAGFFRGPVLITLPFALSAGSLLINKQVKR